MKKLIALVLCLCMTTALFTACSGSNGDTNSDGKTVITYMTWASGGQKEVEKKVIEEFNKSHPDIEVKATFVPGDYLSRMQTLIAGHKEPDIAIMYGNYIHDWAQKGLLADLTPYTQNSTIDFDDMLPMAKFYNQGKLYGATATLETIVVYYNKAIFAAAGVTAEDIKDWTWDEYVEILRKVTVDQNGKHPGESGFNTKKIKTWGTFVPTASYINEPLLWSNGGAYFESDGSGLAVDRPESIEVLQKLTDLTFVEKVAPTSAEMAGMSSQIKMLKDGRLASFISGTYDISGFAAEEWYDYGVAELPIFKESVSQLWGEPIVIFESSKNKEAAFEFMQYLINPESSLTLAQEGSCIPAFKSWYTDPEKFASWADNKYHGEDFRTLIPEQVTNCNATRSIYYVKNSDAVGNVIWSALDQCFLNGKSVGEVVKDLDKKAEPYWQGVWEPMPWLN